MNLFTIKGNESESYNLDVGTYEKYTLKQEPYYKDGKHYAVCPGCGNTLQIISLYNNNNLDKNKRVVKLHARHCGSSIEGFKKYSDEDYRTCPFSNPLNFTSIQKRVTNNGYNEIVEIIKNYPEYLYREINKITGIYFSENKFKEMLKNFIDYEGYNYKYINKFNLPYGFLNVQKSINIYSQSVFEGTELSIEIKKCINERSNYFNVVNNRISKKTNEYAKIKFHLRDHKISKEDGELVQSIRMVIFEEGSGETTKELFNKRIDMELYSFLSMINKANRIRLIAKNLF